MGAVVVGSRGSRLVVGSRGSTGLGGVSEGGGLVVQKPLK